MTERKAKARGVKADSLGNDRKKGKDNSKSTSGCIVSHPFRDKAAKWMGHPTVFLIRYPSSSVIPLHPLSVIPFHPVSLFIPYPSSLFIASLFSLHPYPSSLRYG
jgi:hypothetical protein